MAPGYVYATLHQLQCDHLEYNSTCGIFIAWPRGRGQFSKGAVLSQESEQPSAAGNFALVTITPAGYKRRVNPGANQSSLQTPLTALQQRPPTSQQWTLLHSSKFLSLFLGTSPMTTSNALMTSSCQLYIQHPNTSGVGSHPVQRSFLCETTHFCHPPYQVELAPHLYQWWAQFRLSTNR